MTAQKGDSAVNTTRGAWRVRSLAHERKMP